MTIRYLLSVDAIRAEATGVNGMSLTMFDILEYSSVAREDFSRSLEIQQILMDAGLIRRQNNENPNSADAAAAVAVSPNPRRVKEKKKESKPTGWFRGKLMKWLRDPHKWAKETRSSLMIVSTVISAMTFQAVVNPPGGVLEDKDTKTISEVAIYFFPAFIGCNTISFLASLTVTLLLIVRFPLHNKLCTWLLSISVQVTIAFLALTYLMVLLLYNTKYGNFYSMRISGYFIFLWIVLLVIGVVIHAIRFLLWVMKWLLPKSSKSTSGLKNMNTTGSLSRTDSTHFEENDVPAVV